MSGLDVTPTVDVAITACGGSSGGVDEDPDDVAVTDTDAGTVPDEVANEILWTSFSFSASSRSFRARFSRRSLSKSVERTPNSS